MKKKIFIGLISFISLIGPISCSPKEPAPDPFARPTYDSNTVLQNSNFKAVADASLITVSLTTDKTIPVKGTLNIKDGRLSLAQPDRNGLTELELTIDEASWDSGLTERDDLVRRLFFGNTGQGIRVSYASTGQKLIETLREQKKIIFLKAPLLLFWGNTTLTLHPEVSLDLTPQGYLSIKTLQPISIKISDLNRKSLLAQLIEAAMTTRKEMTIEDVVQVEVLLEFEPLI